MARHPHTRDHRRAHRGRVIQSRSHSIPWLIDFLSSDSPYVDEQAKACARGRIDKTKVPCSCPMCGSDRRHFGHVTMAEKRALLALAELDD